MPDFPCPESRLLHAADALAIAQARADRLHRRVGELAHHGPIPAAELDAIGAELDGILDALETLRADMSGDP